MVEAYELAEKSSIKVDSFDLKATESLSYINENCECFIAINPFTLTSEQNERVKLTHELGHCIQGAFYNRYSPLDIKGQHETRAKRWATNQLVPHNELVEALHSGCCELWELAEHFDVPVSFMKIAIEAYQQQGLL